MTTRSEIRTAAVAAASALAKPGGSVEQLFENAERIEEYIRSGTTIAVGGSVFQGNWPSYDH